MKGRDFVDWDGELVPRILFEAPGVPGACPECGGLGQVPEQIDRERFMVMAPCWRCRMYCATCKKWVLKEGHSHG